MDSSFRCQQLVRHGDGTLYQWGEVGREQAWRLAAGDQSRDHAMPERWRPASHRVFDVDPSFALVRKDCFERRCILVCVTGRWESTRVREVGLDSLQPDRIDWIDLPARDPHSRAEQTSLEV